MRHRISAKGNVRTGGTKAGMAQVFTQNERLWLRTSCTAFSLKPKGELRNGIRYARSLQVWIVTQVQTATDVDHR